MNRYGLKLIGFLLFAGMSRAAFAQTGEDILGKVDAAEFAAADMHVVTTMVLVDKAGGKKTRKLESFQKGSDKRLIRFLEPADVEGMAFLDMGKNRSGQDQMHVYLPAFRKVRRIAGHVKNKPFAGTDFSYEDLGSRRFGDRFDVRSMKEETGFYVLELAPKKSETSQYSKVVMRVRKDDHLFESLVMFDGDGKKHKVLTRDDFRKVGKYVVPHKAKMEDLLKKHITYSRVENVKYDAGIEDEIFSPDRLKR